MSILPTDPARLVEEPLGKAGDNVRRKGFTLIELLVVIAIIAILAAILFPVFITAKNKGQQASCSSNLKQISAAAVMYMDDHKGGTWLDADNIGGKIGSASSYFVVLFPYTRTYKAWICPANVKDAKAADGETSYKINQWTCGYPQVAHLSKIRYASKCWMAVEGLPRSQWYRNRWIQSTIFAGPSWFYYATEARHSDGYNIAYMDGHVAWHRQFTPDQIPEVHSFPPPSWDMYSPEQKKFAWGRATGGPWD